MCGGRGKSNGGKPCSCGCSLILVAPPKVKRTRPATKKPAAKKPTAKKPAAKAKTTKKNAKTKKEKTKK